MKNKYLSEYKMRIGCSIEDLVQRISGSLEGTGILFQITCRVKDADALLRKMTLKKAPSVFSIKDVYGIRILVESAEEAYRVLGEIKAMFPGFVKNDYIAEPKTRTGDPLVPVGSMFRIVQFIGYKNKVPFEVQITTREFHEMNESLHDVYHKRKYAL